VRRPLALICLSLAVALPGCGNKRTQPPKVTTPSAVSAWITVSLPRQAVTFERPKEWQFAPGTGPLLATMTSAGATVAVWRYPRTEALPTTPAQLASARDALVAAAKTRDKTFAVTKAKGTRAAHHPAVVIIARETVAGRLRTVRSTHVYADGGEVVVDAFAPPAQYPQLEDPVFRRIVRSLRVSKPSG
jgi:hypothetical protein